MFPCYWAHRLRIQRTTRFRVTECSQCAHRWIRTLTVRPVLCSDPTISTLLKRKSTSIDTPHSGTNDWLVSCAIVLQACYSKHRAASCCVVLCCVTATQRNSFRWSIVFHSLLLQLLTANVSSPLLLVTSLLLVPSDDNNAQFFSKSQTVFYV